MALTQVERLLIRQLAECGMDEDEIVAVVLCLETMEKKIQMIKWIASEKHPTPQEIRDHLLEMIKADKGEQTSMRLNDLKNKQFE